MIQDLPPLIGSAPFPIRSPLKHLPRDVWQKIMEQYLSIGDCASLSSTCVELRRMAFHSTDRTMSIWTKLFRRDCPVLFSAVEREFAARPPQAAPIAEHRIWSQLYHTRQYGAYRLLHEFMTAPHLRCWAILANGQVATGSNDGILQIWRTDGTLVLQFAAFIGRLPYGVGCIASLPNGRLATCGDLLGAIHIWGADGQLEQTLEGHDGTVLNLAVLLDGRLASGSHDGTIRVWSWRGNEHQLLEGHTDSIYELIVLEDGRLVSGSRDGSIRIWQEPFETSLLFRQYETGVFSLHSLPNNGFAYKLLGDTCFYVVSNPAGDPRVLGQGMGIGHFGVLRGGGFVISGHGGPLRIWPRTQSAPVVIDAHQGAHHFLSLPNGQVAVALREPATVRIFGEPAGELLDRAISRAQASRTFRVPIRPIQRADRKVSWRLVAVISALVLGVILSCYSKSTSRGDFRAAPFANF